MLEEQLENKELDAELAVKKGQKIVLYGGHENRLAFAGQLDIETEHLREEINRLAEVVANDTEDHEYYKNLWYRLLVANKILDHGEVSYGTLFDSIAGQAGSVDMDIFDKVWLEMETRASKTKTVYEQK
jgi:hypothetical protein